MNRFCLVIAVLSALVPAVACADDYSKRPTEALIDDLTTIDANGPGIDDAGAYDAFLADDSAPRFIAGLLSSRPPTINPAMRELVRRGADALPALIKHLSDKRPTKLLVGLEDDLGGLGGQLYADEYDPRVGVSCRPAECGPGLDAGFWYIEMPCKDGCRPFEGKYAVKVGDVCEMLIGQIVNRRLSAVRYQPTNILYVNSPLEQPSLVARIEKDWGGMDGAALEASLLEDLRVHPERFVGGALTRLRFYYPKTYAALSGDDLLKRNKFEADEREERARAARRR